MKPYTYASLQYSIIRLSNRQILKHVYEALGIHDICHFTSWVRGLLNTFHFIPVICDTVFNFLFAFSDIPLRN